MKLLILPVALLLSLAGLAASVGAAERLDVRKIAGVYKKRLQDGLSTGETYPGENILEIVRVFHLGAEDQTRLL